MVIFKALGKTIEGTKWLATEAPLKALGGVMNMTRSAINYLYTKGKGPEALEYGAKEMQYRGRQADNKILAPVLDTTYSILELLGGTPTGVAKKKPGAQKMLDIKKIVGEYRDIARRGAKPDHQQARDSEKTLHEEYEDVILKYRNITPEPETPQEQMYLHQALRGINAERPSGLPQYTLLSSDHPLSELARKEAMFISNNPSKQQLQRPANIMLHSPMKIGIDDEGNERYQETKTGQQKQNIWGHPRFPGMTLEDESRALTAPDTDESGQYSVQLQERKSAFAQRQQQRESTRRSLQATPFSLRVEYGKDGFPEHGDPNALIALLRKENAALFANASWDQIALGIHQTGDVITIAGYVTTGQDHTSSSASTADNTYSQDWYRKALPEKIPEQSGTATLLQHPAFGSASAYAFYPLEQHVESLQEAYMVDLKFDRTAFQENDDLSSRLATTFSFTLNLNGSPEKLKLLAGSDVLFVPLESPIRKLAPKGSSGMSEYMRIEEYLKHLRIFQNRGLLNYRASSVEGYGNSQPQNGSQQPPLQSPPPSDDV